MLVLCRSNLFSLLFFFLGAFLAWACSFDFACDGLAIELIYQCDVCGRSAKWVICVYLLY